MTAATQSPLGDNARRMLGVAVVVVGWVRVAAGTGASANAAANTANLTGG